MGTDRAIYQVMSSQRFYLAKTNMFIAINNTYDKRMKSMVNINILI